MGDRYISGAVIQGAVAVLITESGNRRDAATISFFSELAHHPTSLWVSVARTSATFTLLEESRQFALGVLAENQRELALSCAANSGRDADKCASLDLYRHGESFWFLRGALACSACRVRQTIDVGDHRIYTADILSGVVDSRRAHLRHLLLGAL